MGKGCPVPLFYNTTAVSESRPPARPLQGDPEDRWVFVLFRMVRKFAKASSPLEVNVGPRGWRPFLCTRHNSLFSISPFWAPARFHREVSLGGECRHLPVTWLGPRAPSPSPPGKAPSWGLLPAPISFQFFFSFLHGSPCSAPPHPVSSPCLAPLLLRCICCSVCVTHLLFCLKLPTSFIIDNSLSFQVSPLHGSTNWPLLWPLCSAHLGIPSPGYLHGA